MYIPWLRLLEEYFQGFPRKVWHHFRKDSRMPSSHKDKYEAHYLIWHKLPEFVHLHLNQCELDLRVGPQWFQGFPNSNQLFLFLYPHYPHFQSQKCLDNERYPHHLKKFKQKLIKCFWKICLNWEKKSLSTYVTLISYISLKRTKY